MLRVLVTFACVDEFASWRRLSNFRRNSDFSGLAYSIRTEEAEVDVAITGVGMRALRNLREFLERAPDVCIASGLAGGLRLQHQAGDVLVAKTTRRDLRTPISSDARLVEQARRLGAVVSDCFITVNAIVNSASEKVRFGALADAADMESFDVLDQARDYGVPAVAIRAISDDAKTDMPIDFNELINARGGIRWLPVVAQALKAPARIPEVIRFGAASSRAARNLAAFLKRYIETLSSAHAPISDFAGLEAK